ncbi:MAG: carbohydrate-binding protein [Clostridia bacterium]|nr:carbohydrate-binding protein [Clostridia bacterium]
MAIKIQDYTENGVVLSKASLNVGDEITVTYDGLLAKCGADKVFAYVGYGEEWEEKGFIPMTYEFDTFKATFKVLMDGSMNLAFKDSAENWDNNAGENYTFKVGKKQKAAKAEVEKAEKATVKAKAPATKATKTAAKTTTAKAATKTAAKKTAAKDETTAAKPRATRKKKEEA